MREVRRGHAAARCVGVLAILAAAGCALFFQPPEVRVVGLRVASLGITSGIAELDLEVSNENSSDVDIQGFRYRLDIQRPRGEEGAGEWTELGEGFHGDSTTLKAGETSRVTIQVPFAYEAVGAAARSLLREGEVRYRLEGELGIDHGLREYQVPLRTTGVLSP